MLEELECCTKRAVVVPGRGVDSLIRRGGLVRHRWSVVRYWKCKCWFMLCRVPMVYHVAGSVVVRHT